MPQKKSTQMELIERMYGKDFGIPNDQREWDYLEKIGYGGLVKILKYDAKKSS